MTANGEVTRCALCLRFQRGLDRYAIPDRIEFCEAHAETARLARAAIRLLIGDEVSRDR